MKVLKNIQPPKLESPQSVAKKVEVEKIEHEEELCPEPVKASSDPKGKKLIFAHALWRHGKRNPGAIYKNSLNKEADFIQGMGELVYEGFLEHYTLGQRLRKRFVEDTALVSPEYIENEIKIRSTYVNRTVLSAKSHFMSFYNSGTIPETGLSKEHGIPVHTFSGLTDPILLAAHCQNGRDFIINVIHKTPQFVAFREKYKQFVETAAEKSGHPEYAMLGPDGFYNPYKIMIVCDAIIHEVALGVKRADWVDALAKTADEFVDDYYALTYGLALDPELRIQAGKIFGGPLLWDIINRFKLKGGLPVEDKEILEDKMPSKYYVYSAHDTSLIQLFSALGFSKIGFDTITRPQTADAVTVELWKGDDGSTVVKLYYFRKGLKDPIDMSRLVTGAEDTEEGCTLEQFITRSEIYKPDPDTEYKATDIKKDF